jgi:hypothetical protein
VASTLEQERLVAVLKTSVVSIVTLYRKITRALTHENFRRP